MTAPPLLDRPVLDDLAAAIGAEGARSVIELFLGESRGHVATIAAAAAQPDDAAGRGRARRAAHSLKSGAGQIGAAALSAAAAGVERAAAGGGDLGGAAAALAAQASETEAALSRFLSEG